MNSPLSISSEVRLELSSLTDRDFERVAARVGSMAGIVLEPHKRQMIFSRLSRRLRVRGFDSFDAYLNHLDAGKDTDELQEFVNTLTTNLTSFFREAHHFRHFSTNVLKPKSGAGERLRVWSAGCSSGEEAYTIAMTILDTIGRIGSDVRILATDLDTNMLAKGRAGIYPAARTDGIPKRFTRFIERVANTEDVRMSNATKDAIAFLQLNLLEPWPIKGKFEAVFCRNVMIYFDAATKAALIDRFADVLVPGGFLYLGHSESILGHHPKLTSCGETIYQRTGV